MSRSNGKGKVITDGERQLEINDNLGKTCKYIMATIDIVNVRLDIIQKRLNRLENFAKRSLKENDSNN